MDEDEVEECWDCGGDGYLSETEVECDWVNYSDDEYVLCSTCDGTGYLPKVISDADVDLQ